MSVHDFTGNSTHSLPPAGEPPTMEPMEARLTALETIIPTLATKADVAEVRADIAKGISETQKWMVATVIGMMIGFGGLFLAMSNALKPSPQVQQAPIIINVPGAAAPVAPRASGP